MDEIIEKIKVFGDETIKKYIAISSRVEPGLFGKQTGHIKKVNDFIVTGGEEITDYANNLLEDYDGEISEDMKKIIIIICSYGFP